MSRPQAHQARHGGDGVPEGLAAAHVASQRRDVEQRERVLRLMQGGPRLLRRLGQETGRGESWGLFLRGDMRRRPMAKLTQAQVDAMLAQNRLRPGQIEGALEPVDDLAPLGHMLAAVNPAPVAAPAHDGRRFAGRGYDRLAARLEKGEGPLSERQRQAAERLFCDAEPALRGDVAARAWLNTRIDGASSPGAAPSGVLALRARRRLALVSRACGAEVMELAWGAVVLGQTFAAIARRHGWRAGEVAGRVCDALDVVATAYDGMGRG